MGSSHKHTLIGKWESCEPGTPWLEFTPEGIVTGSDGCNGIVSTFVVSEEGATIDMFVSTLRACVGVDDWLRGVHTVQLRGDALVVFDRSGARLGELQRVNAG